MFTGIVERVGVIAARRPREGAIGFSIEAPEFARHVQPGDSVAIDGVCLTATSRGETEFMVDAVQTTISRTTLGGWEVGREVNLERALAAGDPLGGHLVQGHVDRVGVVTGIVGEGDMTRMEVRVGDSVAAVTVERGSLAIDGVSLTVAGLEGDVAEFAIIPYTWSHTTLGRLEPGARVNVEADLIGKYVRRLVGPYQASGIAIRDVAE